MSGRSSQYRPPAVQPRSSSTLRPTSSLPPVKKSWLNRPSLTGRPSTQQTSKGRLSSTTDKPRTISYQKEGGKEVITHDGKKFWVTDEEYDYYKEAFNLFDRDKSGAIDVEELGAVMASIGLQPSKVELLSMIGKVDADNTGTVEFDEFLQMTHEWMIHGRIETDDQIQEAFEFMDVDGNGYISAQDLAEVMQGLFRGSDQKSPEELMDMIKEFDVDGDGQIGYDDFFALMKDHQ